MKRTLALPVVAALLVLPACADNSLSGPMVSAPKTIAANASAKAGLTLHPDGFGEDSYAAWRPNEGLPDSRGGANMALYLQKMTATTTNAAGIARIDGIEGTPLSAVSGLSWEHRTDGWCGAGAPRWTFVVADASGDRGVIHLGCAAAVHTPGSAPNWIRDSYPGPAVLAAPVFGFTREFNAADVLTISALYIIFDEGTDIPVNPGYVYLDNITVNDKVFTSPADNGSN